MNKKSSIAITGATGTLGKLLIGRFENEGIPVRALARDLKKAKKIGWKLAEIQRFDFECPATFKQALKGIDKLVLVTTVADDNLRLLMEEAANKALSHVIIISGISAEKYRNMPLALVERSVYETRIPFTALRLNWFMQNFTSFLLDEIVNKRLIALPAEAAKTSFIDLRDISDVAYTILTDESEYFLNKAFPLTGPTPLDHYAIAEGIGKACGDSINYVPLSDEEGYLKFLDLGWGKDSAAKMAMLYRGVKEGATEQVTPWVEKILGRPPRSFDAFVNEHANLWKPSF